MSNNRYDDLVRKLGLYQNADVRKYWIIDPQNECTIVYVFDEMLSLNIYTFDQPVPVGIYGGELTITVTDMI